MDGPDRRPDLVSFAEAFLFGVVVPGSSLLALDRVPDPGIFVDELVFVWLVGLALATAGLGRVRAIPTDALLGGTLLGLATGWLVSGAVLETDFVLLVLAILSAVPVVIGSWLAYELRRRDGAEGTDRPWRYVFVALLLGVFGVVALTL